MNTQHIIEHLKIAKSIAKADKNDFLAYLIQLAIEGAKSSGGAMRQEAPS
jgi:uncharacterized pyridoxal phosphate-containing UPF0001 family protein